MCNLKEAKQDWMHNIFCGLEHFCEKKKALQCQRQLKMELDAAVWQLPAVIGGTALNFGRHKA